MKKNQRFEFKLTAELKAKLIRDSIMHMYSCPSSYLAKLIEMGPPVDDKLNIRLKLIEMKIDTLSRNILSDLETLSRNLKTVERDINRMQSIDKKIDTLSSDILNILNTISSNLKTFEGDINKRTYLTFRIASYVLARTFIIKKGALSDIAVNEVQKFINNETSDFEKKSGRS